MIKDRILEKGIVVGLIVDEYCLDDVRYFVECIAKENGREILPEEERIHLIIVDLVHRHHEKQSDQMYNQIMLDEKLICQSQLFIRRADDVNEKFIARNIVIDEAPFDHVTFVELSSVYRDEMIFDDVINRINENSRKLRNSNEQFINFNGEFEYDDEGLFKTDFFIKHGPFLTTPHGWDYNEPNKRNHYKDRLKNVK